MGREEFRPLVRGRGRRSAAGLTWPSQIRALIRTHVCPAMNGRDIISDISLRDTGGTVVATSAATFRASGLLIRIEALSRHVSAGSEVAFAGWIGSESVPKRDDVEAPGGFSRKVRRESPKMS